MNEARQHDLRMNEPAHRGLFEPATPVPTLAAAHARIAALWPPAYARTRNHLAGAVSGLSPYVTHGLVSLRDIVAGVTKRHPLEVQHKLLYELGWREYYRHVWAHRGDGILASLHPGPLPDDAYARELPADVREARTGVPAIDTAVRTLYATGLLHNHARMWLASYLVHLRKVHWRTAADWLYGHLLDGDLASNHLSWQWVAGTASRKPYLFNAANVARYAGPEWQSAGSVIDTSYEAMDRWAHQRQPLPPPRAPVSGVEEPPCFDTPPDEVGATSPDAALVRGRHVWLVHPWSLGALPATLPADTLVIGVFVADFHHAWPWTARRWSFAGQRLAAITPHRWHADAATLAAALAGARSVYSAAEPHLAAWLPRLATGYAAPTLFPPVARCCDSFSQWWRHASRGLHHADELLAPRESTTSQHGALP